MTHYDTLEISLDATAAAIRTAYRQLVLATHPDRTPDPAAHSRYLAVNAAYEVLSDPTRKHAYDASLESTTVADRPILSGRARDEARRRAYVHVPKAPNLPNSARYAKEYALVLKWTKPLLIAAMLLPVSLVADYFQAIKRVEQVADYERKVYYTGGGRYSRSQSHTYYQHFTAFGTFNVANQLENGTRVVVCRTPLWHKALAVYDYPQQILIEEQDYLLVKLLVLVLPLLAGFSLITIFNADCRLNATLSVIFGLLLLINQLL
jgi:DnaJ domain